MVENYSGLPYPKLMAKRIYVGNLSYDTSEEDLKQAFAAVGEVASVNIITDKFSGKSKGFGFVEMADDKLADEAIKQLNNKDVAGRNLRVSEARPQEKRDFGGPPAGEQAA